MVDYTEETDPRKVGCTRVLGGVPGLSLGLAQQSQLGKELLKTLLSADESRTQGTFTLIAGVMSAVPHFEPDVIAQAR
jgi:hypothetical protein